MSFQLCEEERWERKFSQVTHFNSQGVLACVSRSLERSS